MPHVEITNAAREDCNFRVRRFLLSNVKFTDETVDFWSKSTCFLTFFTCLIRGFTL